MGEGVDTSQLSVFDGHYLYSNTWNPPADLTATNQKFAARVAQMSAATGAAKLWVATVMPGYNDVGVRPNSGFVQGRDGGDYYARSWQAAIAGNPNWVVITSFNEWPEGTYIEPSAAYGDAYIGLTAQYAAQFRAGGGAPVTAAAPAPAAASPAADGATEESNPATGGTDPAAPTVFVQADVLNLRAGPGRAYALLGAVVAGDALPILGKAADSDDASWWQVKTVIGPAWVFGEYVQAAGPLDQVPAVAVQPAATGE
ncbi:MAG: SH3 domain-containing protein [Albidovulum sp.]